MYYLRNREYLRASFPISEAAEDILHKILTPNPKHCIGLLELRKLVEEADTFFMTEAEIAQSSETLRLIADYLRPRVPAGPIPPAQENNPPSEGLPIFVLLSTTSDDVSDSDGWTTASESASQAEDEVPRAVRLRNVVPLVEEDSLGDGAVAWRRGEKTAAAPIAADGPSTPTDSTDSSTVPDSASTTSSSGGGIRSFFRITRQPRKTGADDTVAGDPSPDMSSWPPITRLVRRLFGGEC